MNVDVTSYFSLAIPILWKFLILDLNKVIFHSQPFEGLRAKLSRVTSEKGEVIFTKYKILCLRRGMRQFIANYFENFNVGIWSCSMKHNLYDILHAIFPNDMEKFVFVRTQKHNLKTGISYESPRTTKKECMDRMFQDIWKVSVGNQEDHSKTSKYNDSNTVIVDNTTHKCIFNPKFISLFFFSFYEKWQNNFLLDSLWRVLKKLTLARDVRFFLRENTPKWSIHISSWIRRQMRSLC